MQKKSVKSLRYTDEFLLLTNDYYLEVASYIYLQGIKPTICVKLEKTCQTAFFLVKLPKITVPVIFDYAAYYILCDTTVENT